MIDKGARARRPWFRRIAAVQFIKHLWFLAGRSHFLSDCIHPLAQQIPPGLWLPSHARSMCPPSPGWCTFHPDRPGWPGKTFNPRSSSLNLFGGINAASQHQVGLELGNCFHIQLPVRSAHTGKSLGFGQGSRKNHPSQPPGCRHRQRTRFRYSKAPRKQFFCAG